MSDRRTTASEIRCFDAQYAAYHEKLLHSVDKAMLDHMTYAGNSVNSMRSSDISMASLIELREKVCKDMYGNVSMSSAPHYTIQDYKRGQSLSYTQPTINRRVVNPIFKVRWAGWESDSLTLQRNGWVIGYEEALHNDSFGMVLRFSIKHPEFGVHGYSSLRVSDEEHYHVLRSLECGNMHIDTAFDFQLARDITVQSAQPITFKPYDAEPRFEELTETRISDAAIFRCADNDIIVDPASVPDLMAKILECQAPKQKDIRKKARRSHGNLVSME